MWTRGALEGGLSIGTRHLVETLLGDNVTALQQHGLIVDFFGHGTDEDVVEAEVAAQVDLARHLLRVTRSRELGLARESALRVLIARQTERGGYEAHEQAGLHADLVNFAVEVAHLRYKLLPQRFSLALVEELAVTHSADVVVVDFEVIVLFEFAPVLHALL